MPYADPERQRKYQREWQAKRRADWLEANGPCRECGSRSDLQVDHITRKGKVDHKLWSWSAKRRAKELAKCQVLCRECHHKKTGRENGKPLIHGTLIGYKEKRCRCDLCRAANAKRMRMYLAGESWCDARDCVT